MSDFTKLISRFVTCEICREGKVSYFAKLDDGSWVAVKDDGSLDCYPVNSTDFNDVLKSLESLGANIRLTNHSAI